MNITNKSEPTLNSTHLCDVSSGDFNSFNFSSYDYPNPNDTSQMYILSYLDYVKIVVCVITIVVILIGNSGVIIAVAMNRSLRNTINYYLTNLAVADVLICGCCLWVHLINNLTEPLYVLGPFMCKFNGFAQMTCLTSSVLTLSAISCDRFVAILFPLRARVTKQRTGLIISCIWGLSLVVSVPFLIYRKHHEIQWRNFLETICIEIWPAVRQYDPTRGECITSYPTKKLYYTIVTVILFFAPVLIMASAYSLIVWRLWVHQAPGEMNKNLQRVQENSKKKVIKMVCIVLLVFVISWMPLQMIVLYSQFVHSSHDYGELPSWFSLISYISTFIAYSNSALNPIIYGGFNRTFRHALYSLLKCHIYINQRRCYRGNKTATETPQSSVQTSAFMLNDCNNKRCTKEPTVNETVTNMRF